MNITVDKFSAFRHRDIVKYLQCLCRVTDSEADYSTNIEYINEAIIRINNIQEDNMPYQQKIKEIYRLIYSEISMCDNYVKFMLENHRSFYGLSLGQMVLSIENNFDLRNYLAPYYVYRERLTNIAEQIISLVDDINLEELHLANIELFNVVSTTRPNFYKVSDFGHEPDVFTPFDVDIDDVAYIWFDNVEDYRLSLERCKKTIRCKNTMNSDIKKIKDINNTLYSATMRLLYDKLSKMEYKESGITTYLLFKILIRDIMLRDCQSSQPELLQENKMDRFITHLYWRNSRWVSAMTLYDISDSDHETTITNIRKLFESVISNSYQQHVDINLRNEILSMDIDDIMNILTRYIHP